MGQRRVQPLLRIAIMVVATVALLGHIHLVAAAEKTNTANTLKVSPVRTDVQIKPGESKIVKTNVTNLTDSPITVRPIENDFVSGDERGTPALILDANEFAPTHSLKRFLKPLDDVTIPARESKTINVQINVPKNAQAGGYFGAVRFAPTSPDSGGQVNLSASVASLILLSVPGDTVEKLELTNFNVQQNGKVSTYFGNPDNIQLAVRFQNKGNVQLSPFGKVSVKKGDSVVYETDFNTKIPADVTLPDSARRWDIPLKDIGKFGHYTVSATFTYGKKNQTIQIDKSFWVIPLAVIIGGIVGLIVLIGLIVGIWFFLRNYKRRVLRGSRNRHSSRR